MSEFTKGKWIFYGEFLSEADTILDDDMHPIAYVYSRDDSEANGRLIAAAPDMYKILDGLIYKLKANGADEREEIDEAIQEIERLIERIDGKEAQE